MSIRRFWIFAGALCIALSAAQAEERVETEELTYVLSVEAAYPKFGDARIDEQVKSWVEHTVGWNVSRAGGNTMGGESGTWDLSAQYETTRPSDKAVSVVLTIFTSTSGAAHPSTEIATQSFSTQTGKRIDLDHVFADHKAALAILAENAPRLIAETLMKEHPEQFSDGFDNEAFFMEGFRPTAENYAAFSLEPEGIRIYFQHYQVLPYVFGIQTPLFPLSLLEPAGPSPDIWPVAER